MGLTDMESDPESDLDTFLNTATADCPPILSPRSKFRKRAVQCNAADRVDAVIPALPTLDNLEETIQAEQQKSLCSNIPDFGNFPVCRDSLSEKPYTGEYFMGILGRLCEYIKILVWRLLFQSAR